MSRPQYRYLIFGAQTPQPKGGAFDLQGDADSIEDAVDAYNKLAKTFDIVHIFDCHSHQIIKRNVNENWCIDHQELHHSS